MEKVEGCSRHQGQRDKVMTGDPRAESEQRWREHVWMEGNMGQAVQSHPKELLSTDWILRFFFFKQKNSVIKSKVWEITSGATR